MARVKTTAKDEPATEVVLSTVRSIDLDTDDWLWATWRPRTPRPRPEPAPFDLEACLKRFAKVKQGPQPWNCSWSKLQLSPHITREEARFWFAAMIESQKKVVPPATLVDELRAAAGSYREDPTPDEFTRKLRERSENWITHLWQPSTILLLHFFSLPDLIALSREGYGFGSRQQYYHPLIDHALIDGFRRHVLPYLTDAESATMRDQLRPEIGIPSDPQSSSTHFPLAIHLAAVLGMHEEVHRYVASIPDDRYVGKSHHASGDRPQQLVLGLGSPSAVVSEMRRLKLRLRTPDEVRGWLAHTEDSALDDVRYCILTNTNKDECARFLEVLARVKSPIAAVPMLGLMLSTKVPAAARRWLDENPGHAIPGLIPITIAKGKLAEAAVEYLRAQRRKGHEAFLRECLATAPPEAAEKVRRMVLDRASDAITTLDAETSPEWLRSACEQTRGLKPPRWVGPGDLPPILIDGRKLESEQEQTVLAALAGSTLDSPHPMVVGLRAHADRRSIAAFAWSLYERWIKHEAPPKERWALEALGLLGCDDTAHDLAALIRPWAGQARHSRAVIALGCLRRSAPIWRSCTSTRSPGSCPSVGSERARARSWTRSPASAAFPALSWRTRSSPPSDSAIPSAPSSTSARGSFGLPLAPR